jgi:hypothetical protein
MVRDDDVTQLFTKKTLTPIVGQPGGWTMKLMFRELCGNLGNVPTSLGGGANGYLGMSLGADQYLTLPNAVAFVDPVRPAATPHIPAQSSQTAIGEILRAHKHTVKEFNTGLENLTTG